MRRRLLLVSLSAVAACDDPGRPEPVDALQLTAPTQYLDVGQTISLDARATGTSGESLGSNRIEWRSSDPGVAAVAAGQVTGRAPGEVVIHASAGGRSDSVRLTVERPVASLSVAPDSAVLLPGRSGRLFVDMADASGQPLAHSLALSSSAPGVVAVEEGGAIRGIAAGSAVVTVRAGLKSAELPVRVVPGDRFRVRVLGTLGGDTSRANALNNRREVVGESRVAGNGAVHPFLWRHGGMVDLGVPAGSSYGRASDVSDRGEVVGVAHRPHPNPGLLRPVYSAWRWRSGARSAIEIPGVSLVSSDMTSVWLDRLALNDSGHVVLEHVSVTSGGGTHVSASTYLARGKGVTRITAPGSEDFADYTAGGINRRGTVAFTRWFDVSYGGTDPVVHLWKDGQTAVGPRGMVARGINDHSLVVGRCGTSPNLIGCTWDGSTRRDVPGTTTATAVNGHGDVLATGADGKPVLVRGGTLIRLDDAAGVEWEVVTASDLNDWGEISATGRNRSTGEVRALLLTPS
ncbi:MAG TPA: hypothetical protein VGR37_10980 [Longimicrobiaceae bacterium]|nr:hypothetical protein [Longimicrobiaceae bacterium]